MVTVTSQDNTELASELGIVAVTCITLWTFSTQSREEKASAGSSRHRCLTRTSTRSSMRGRLAPSANNTQPWSFVVIKDKALLAKMADAVREMIDRMIPFAENEKQAQRLAAYKGTYYTFFEHAPVVIAVFMEGYDAGTDRLLARMGYSAGDIKRLRPSAGTAERFRRDPEHASCGPRARLRLLLDDRTARGAGGVRKVVGLRQGYSSLPRCCPSACRMRTLRRGTGNRLKKWQGDRTGSLRTGNVSKIRFTFSGTIAIIAEKNSPGAGYHHFSCP